MLKLTVSDFASNHRLITIWFSSYNIQIQKVTFLNEYNWIIYSRDKPLGFHAFEKENHNIGPLIDFVLSHFCINMFKQSSIIACSTKHFLSTSTMHQQMLFFALLLKIHVNSQMDPLRFVVYSIYPGFIDIMNHQSVTNCYPEHCSYCCQWK